jgi:hypothetical protein
VSRNGFGQVFGQLLWGELVTTRDKIPTFTHLCTRLTLISTNKLGKGFKVFAALKRVVAPI